MSNTGVLLLESITLTVGVLVIHYFVEYCRSPLKQFDGPFWAKFTDWWRLIAASYFNIQETQLHLHRKYGPAVGIGPNCISLSDPSLVKVVYTARGNFKKVRWIQSMSCEGPGETPGSRWISCVDCLLFRQRHSPKRPHHLKPLQHPQQ